MDQHATDEAETAEQPQDDGDGNYEITYRGLPLPHIVMQGNGLNRPWDF